MWQQQNLCFCFVERRCRCLANNASCWPNAGTWQRFNESVDGLLLLPKPSAAVCDGKTYDAKACAVAKAQWSNSSWRSDQVGAMQNHNWENSSCSVYADGSKCNQGSVPVFAVNAILPEHVQTTVRFAAENNLRLVIKTTGHDYLGRSGAAGSLLLWLHHMKNLTLIQQYSACDGTKITNAARLGAGVQWAEVYKWLDAFNLTAVGGAAGTVSAVGGYLQGGGHSPLSRFKGLAVDQVLEYDVVMANGERQTVSACQHSDLFWALSGGGGGTYAIVLSAVVRTFSTPYMVGVTYEINAPNNDRYLRLLQSFIQWLPTLADSGWAGYFSMADMKLSGIFQIPNGDLTTVNGTLIQFATNNPDLDFSKTNLFALPSFYAFSANVFGLGDPTGFHVLISSRLIPDSNVRNDPNKVAQVFFEAKGESSTGSNLIGSLVAGGQVSNVSIANNSVNPGWRTALLHMMYAQGWLDSTSEADPCSTSTTA